MRPASSPLSSRHTIAVLPIPPRPATVTSRIPGSVTYRASRPVSTCRSWNQAGAVAGGGLTNFDARTGCGSAGTCSRWIPLPIRRARLGQVPQRAFHQLPERGRVREGLRGQPAVLHPAAERVLAGPELAIDQSPTAGYPHRQRRCPAGTPAGPGPPRWRCRTPAPYTTPPACPAPGSRTGCPAPPRTPRTRAPARRTPARGPDRRRGSRPYPRSRARPRRSPAPPPPRTTFPSGSPAARRCAR